MRFLTTALRRARPFAQSLIGDQQCCTAVCPARRRCQHHRDVHCQRRNTVKDRSSLQRHLWPRTTLPRRCIVVARRLRHRLYPSERRLCCLRRRLCADVCRSRALRHLTALGIVGHDQRPKTALPHGQVRGQVPLMQNYSAESLAANSGDARLHRPRPPASGYSCKTRK
ncbi:hypothetical protein B296_00053050 [Ensete ventricosum]|uniref:Uncharacterized protein n=1 Tax=Ensete ventricosum TaxID=4639 RepID=A0A426XD58_ENSVE|nr:hypothetical protein B296_00053050 [Ensete ventricosum]